MSRTTKTGPLLPKANINNKRPNNFNTTKTNKHIKPQDKYAKAQACARGYLARKAYPKLVRKRDHRDNVVKEILATEQSYVRSLSIMIDIYLVPLKEDPKKYDISKEDIQIIFANIETIVNLHKEMLKGLEERVKYWGNATKIGDIFINFAPFLKMLNGYCGNYDSAITVLAQMRQDKRPFAAFLEKCELMDGVQSLTSYLIQPIQRVPRYNLLLEDLIRNTWEWHIDYETLCNALRAMKQIADHINEGLRKSEKANKVVKIQSDLGGECDIVEPHRRWIRDGPVIRVKRQGQTSSPVSTNKLWIYLFNDMVVFAGRILISYRFIEKYSFDSMAVQDLEGTDKFHISSIAAQSAYILSTETEDVKNDWLSSIDSAIQDYNNAIELKAEQRRSLDRDLSTTNSPRSQSISTPSPLPSPPTHTSLPAQPNQSDFQRSQSISTPSPLPSPPTHTSLPTQPNPSDFQQQLAHRLTQRNQTTSLPSSLPSSYVPQSLPIRQAPVSPNAARIPAKPIPPTSPFKKFDFASMPVTEIGGDEEDDEMTFAERRLMFERGLLTQAQAQAKSKAPAPRKPVVKPSTFNAKVMAGSPSVAAVPSPSIKQIQAKVSEEIAKANANQASVSPNTVKKIEPRNSVTQQSIRDIPQGIVGNRVQKYQDPNEEVKSPLIGKDQNNDKQKKDSGCCVIL